MATTPHHNRANVPDAQAVSDGLAHALVRHSSDGLVVIDREGCIRYASRAATSMLGYTAEAVIGLNAFDLVHAEDQVSALEGFASTMSTGDSRPLPLLVRLKRADGTWHQTELIGTNHLADEHIDGLLLNIRDVTASMRTEAALRASEERHRLIVELAREGIWLIDATGQTTFANLALAQMLDTTVPDLLSSSIYDFLAEDPPAEGDGTAPSDLPAGEYEVRLVTRMGRSLWTHINSSPIIDSANRYVGAVALVTDVSERRALQDTLALAARRDPLTGVANRVELFEQLATVLRGNALVTALYVDLDDFKAVNDNHGHATGDIVLHAVASRLCAAVRHNDIVARMGGDEFVVITDGVEGPASAFVLGRRICDSLQEPFGVGDLKVRIGASVGIAAARGGEPDALLSRADEALYRAKRTGRGRVELANLLVA